MADIDPMLRDRQYETDFYYERAQATRQKLITHMGAVGLASNNTGIAVHRLDDRHPSQLFGPGAHTEIYLESRLPVKLFASPARTVIHMLTKEWVPKCPNNTFGILYNHYMQDDNNIATLRHYMTRIDFDTGEPIEHIPAGPYLLYDSETEEVNFGDFPTGDRLRPSADDAFLNKSSLDMFHALNYANQLLDVLSADTVIYSRS